MATILQMKSNCRILLADPKPQKPSDRHTLLAVLRQTQGLYNRLSNTGAAWDVGELSLNAVSGQQGYQTAVDSSFGKPLQVVRTGTGYAESPVDFFEMGNLSFDWGRPESYAGGVERIGWYRSNGILNLKVLPIPQQSASYRITYSIGNWMDTASLDDSPVLSEFHPLVETLAARSLLAASEWSDDKKADAEKRKELAQIFSADVERMDDDFTRYSLSLTQPRMTARVSSFDEEW